MGEVDWWFVPEKKTLNWPVTDRLHIDPSCLVAVIDAKSDFHYKEIGRPTIVSPGSRIHKKETRIQEPCLLVYLVVSSGDHGWWTIPHGNTHYQYGFHPCPRFYYRSHVPDSPAAELMLSSGLGPKDFLRKATALRMNGGVHSDGEIEVARKEVLADYRAIFEEDLVLK